MHFEYEIGPDEYAASTILYYKLSTGRKRIRGVVVSVLLAFLFIFVAVSRGEDFRWDDFFLIAIALWWLYELFKYLFPARYYRRAYRSTDLSGKKFKADIDDESIDVAGEDCSWRVRWSGVRFKGESETLFMICSAGTIFMFGKKYLTDQQQQELRRLAGLIPS